MNSEQPRPNVNDNNELSLMTQHNDSELQHLTPSKIPVNIFKRGKRPAEKKKYAFESKEGVRAYTLRELASEPLNFLDNRPVPEHVRQAFWSYFDSNEDLPRDYQICDINKEFYNVLINEEGWLTDTVILILFKLYLYLFIKVFTVYFVY